MKSNNVTKFSKLHILTCQNSIYLKPIQIGTNTENLAHSAVLRRTSNTEKRWKEFNDSYFKERVKEEKPTEVTKK